LGSGPFTDDDTIDLWMWNNWPTDKKSDSLIGFPTLALVPPQEEDFVTTNHRNNIEKVGKTSPMTDEPHEAGRR
jgi:hypothetical protein